MPCGTDPQPGLDTVFESSDRDACHASMIALKSLMNQAFLFARDQEAYLVAKRRLVHLNAGRRVELSRRHGLARRAASRGRRLRSQSVIFVFISVDAFRRPDEELIPLN
jgi:hypothetical protein